MCPPVLIASERAAAIKRSRVARPLPVEGGAMVSMSAGYHKKRFDVTFFLWSDESVPADQGGAP
jgi:hypothetical protein